MKRYDFGTIIIVNKSPRIIWKKANEIENKQRNETRDWRFTQEESFSEKSTKILTKR